MKIKLTIEHQTIRDEIIRDIWPTVRRIDHLDIGSEIKRLMCKLTATSWLRENSAIGSELSMACIRLKKCY